MKKVIAILVICIITITSNVFTCSAEEIKDANYYHLNLESENIKSIKIDCNLYGNGRPMIADSKMDFDYLINDKNELLYVIHYLNSFNLIDIANFGACDVPIVNVDVTRTDGTIAEMGFIDGYFYKRNDNPNSKKLYRDYKTDYKEYQQFIDLVYALKTKKIKFDGDVTFKPSDWAKSYMDEAIKDNLVPQKYQINYTGKINRYDFCQLIYNYLEKENLINTDTVKEKSPFTDTDDSNILALFKNQIIKGKSSSEFCPYDNITREELAVILNNVYKYMKKGTQNTLDCQVIYKDKDDFASWSKDCINQVSSLKLMQGNENNEFMPKNNTTKQEAIITILKLFNLNSSNVLAP